MLADGYTGIPNTEISYVGWLTKEFTLKRTSSIVMELTDPETANAIINVRVLHLSQQDLFGNSIRLLQALGIFCTSNLPVCLDRKSTPTTSPPSRTTPPETNKPTTLDLLGLKGIPLTSSTSVVRQWFLHDGRRSFH